MDIIQLLGLQDVDIPQQTINILSRGSIYSLFALGYAIVFSVLGVLNLSHSAVFTWGAFIGITTVCGDSVVGGTCTVLQRPIWTAIPVAIVGAGVLSVTIDRLAFYPLRKRDAPRLSQLISSIGVAIVLVNLAQRIYGADPKRYPVDKVPDKPIRIPLDLDIESPINLVRVTFAMLINDLGITISLLKISVMLISVLLMVLLSYVVTKTRLGQGMRTVAFQARTGSLLGVNPDNIYMVAFFISGALAGAGGVLYSLAFNTVRPSLGEELALKGLTVIVLGGLGSIRGAVLGGFFVALIEVYIEAATDYAYLSNAFVFLLFFLILLLRPQGILGQAVETRA